MSMLTGDSWGVDQNMIAEFSRGAGRYPTQQEAIDVTAAWNSYSYDDFQKVAARYKGTAPSGPLANQVVSAPGTMMDMGSNQFLSALGPLLGPIGSMLGGLLTKPTTAPVVGGILGSAIPPLLAPTSSGTAVATIPKGGKAPLASFFGGNCPPGRVLRKKPMARDICIKKPRMNPFNPRALARADRRMTSFARRSKAILHDLGYKVGPRKKSLATKKRRR